MSSTIVNTPPFSGAFKRPLIGGSGGNSGNSNSTVKKPPVDSTGWWYTRCKEDTNYSFAWTIEGFRRKMEQFSNGQCLTSHVFK